MVKFINSGLHSVIVDELVSSFSTFSTELVVGISLYDSVIPTPAQTSSLTLAQKLELFTTGAGYNRLYTGYAGQNIIADNRLFLTSDKDSNLVLDLQHLDRFYPDAMGICRWFYILKFDKLSSGGIAIGSDIGCIGSVGQQATGSDIEISSTTTSLSIPVTFNSVSLTLPKQFI